MSSAAQQPMCAGSNEGETISLYNGALCETVRGVSLGDVSLPAGVVLEVKNIDPRTNMLVVESFNTLTFGGVEPCLASGSLRAFHEDGQPNVRWRSAETFFEVIKFGVGSQCEALTALTVRDEEGLDTREIGCIAPWAQVSIVEQGRFNDRRAKVSSGDLEGWISLVSIEGAPMVQLRPAARNKPRGGRRGRVTAATQRLLEVARDGHLPELIKMTGGSCGKHRVNSAYTDIEGRTALMLAAGMGHSEVVEHMLHKDCGLREASATDDGLRSALHWVAARATQKMAAGNPVGGPHHVGSDLVQMLVRHGCDKDGQDLRGQTPLMFAAMSNDLEICKQLLDVSASLHVRDRTSRGALEHAAACGHDAILAMLRSVGQVSTVEATVRKPPPKIAAPELLGTATMDDQPKKAGDCAEMLSAETTITSMEAGNSAVVSIKSSDALAEKNPERRKTLPSSAPAAIADNNGVKKSSPIRSCEKVRKTKTTEVANGSLKREKPRKKGATAPSIVPSVRLAG
mmetsp:Transcript_115595/g.331897  ORF Transcript_115595/g.331897 Transcript_115595/m.331897 type:complete len:514 (+) Transcript_115595:106-1647(+)